MTNGKQLRIFYHNGVKWVSLAYSTSDSLSYSNETQTISSKDHGKYPEQITVRGTWSFSNEALFSPSLVNVILGMAKSGDAYSFAFAEVAELDYNDGLRSVTGEGDNAEFTISPLFANYGDGIVTSAQVSGSESDAATVSLEITGVSRLSDTAPETPKSYNS